MAKDEAAQDRADRRQAEVDRRLATGRPAASVAPHRGDAQRDASRRNAGNN